MTPLTDLRQYPVPFAQAIVRLRKALLDTRPEHLYPIELPPGLVSVRNAPPAHHDDLFTNARLQEVVVYLRAGKNLDLPKHWREGVSWFPQGG